MNVLAREKQTQVIAALVEGTSIRATERMMDVNRETVMNLGVAVGEGCATLHDRIMRDVQVNVLEIDELWSFIGKKEKRCRSDDAPEKGDSYTFLGLDANRKAIVSYAVGKRDEAMTTAFIGDLRARIVGRPQITSDGFKPYIDAIEQAFGADVDYAQIVKEYRAPTMAPVPTERRYAPAKIVRTERIKVAGSPRPELICTSYVERTNLSVRMGTRRFTRLTNAFSKKARNHAAAVALFVAYYNLCRVHETLRIAPAMAIGVTDHVWSIAELIAAALAPQPAPQAPATPSRPVTIPLAAGKPHLVLIQGGVA